MRIILLKDVAKVGQIGTIVDVSDGMAFNKLIPNGLAIQATPEKIAAHKAMQEKEMAKRAEEARLLGKAVQALEGKRIEFSSRATEKGGLFKSIGAKEIAQALKKEGSQVPEQAIELSKPIKEVGEHTVSIKFGDARARITVAVKAL